MSKTFQPPPGTRDFYPEDMALRRYIEDTWRRVSLRHGFVEVDGPTFEYLDLYKVKSGDEIVSQLFHFESRGEDKTQFALRPEFTPTLARMVAAKANSLPRPIKWFSIPRCYRAERPQKGRLREFIQWNVDMLGGETPEARRQFDLEVAALALDCLREFGVTKDDVRLRWNNREIVEDLFKFAGLKEDLFSFGFYLLDRVSKLSPQERTSHYVAQNLPKNSQDFFEKIATGKDPSTQEFWAGSDSLVEQSAYYISVTEQSHKIGRAFDLMGLPGYAKYDASIVRGLAYYTGFVWEISDTRGNHRAIAGGGRYDKLIEMFGGPPLPATGFGAGDVTLVNLLEELKKLPASLATAPDVFVINALATPDEATKLIGSLRAAKLAVGVTYKSTKNIGKLLQDASNSGAKLALILAPAEFDRSVAKIKTLATREETEIPLTHAVATLRDLVRP